MITLALMLKGEISLSHQQPAVALDYLIRAVRLAEGMHSFPLLWQSQFTLGRVLEVQGRKEAQVAYQQAMVTLQMLADKIGGPVLKEAYLKQKNVQQVFEAAQRSSRSQ